MAKPKYLVRFNQRDKEGRLFGLINDDPAQIGYPSARWKPPRPKFGEIWPVRLVGASSPYQLMPAGKPITGRGRTKKVKVVPHWKNRKLNKKGNQE